uniref:Zgc:113054 n=1 Tax=Gadus morhua TaxID=8049 RepID=A0A8C5AYN9_GADMO
MKGVQVSDTPMEFLVEYLTRAQEICDGMAHIPAELKDNLGKALELASGLDHYLEGMTSKESEQLAELNAETVSHDWDQAYKDGKTMFCLPKECITGHVEGQTLKMLVRMSKARRVLEVGMFTGYGALSMAEGLPQDGQLVACELEPYLKEFSQPFFDKSPHGKKITVKTGPAMDTLKDLADAGEQFDMGRVYLREVEDENAKALRRFNQFVCDDPRVEQVIVPLRDGLSIIRLVPMATASTLQQSPITDDVVFRGVGGASVLGRMRLDGKVAYVTGAGQGIGRGFAHALGEAGAKVAVVDIDEAKAKSVVEELTLKGIRSIPIVADISESEDVQRMVDTVVSTWGTIHIACNNAGINMNSASEDTTLSEWDKTFNVNLRGTFMCCQAAGRVMLKQGYGKIINTASMASLIVPHPQKQLSYNASKAGVVKLTQTLGTEWIDRGVNVNCISPGIVDTPLIHSESLRPLVQRWLSDVPAGRLAQVTDLQAALVYLACDASNYMTGHNLVIEGGQSLW